MNDCLLIRLEDDYLVILLGIMQAIKKTPAYGPAFRQRVQVLLNQHFLCKHR
jgi:hypothetical protein